MKNLLGIMAAFLLIILASCNGTNTQTDLNQNEQAAVDSTLSSDEAAMDSLENAIMSQIGEDSVTEEDHQH